MAMESVSKSLILSRIESLDSLVSFFFLFCCKSDRYSLIYFGPLEI